MKSLIMLAALALMALCSCDSIGPASKDGLVVRSGTSFGMCRGYCVKDVTITPSSAVFVERSNGDSVQFPTKTKTLPVTREEWDALAASLNMDSLSKLDTVIGCPDCADGGAEWIEVELKGTRRKVTFEHGKDLPPIAPFLEKVRAIRSRNG